MAATSDHGTKPFVGLRSEAVLLDTIMMQRHEGNPRMSSSAVFMLEEPIISMGPSTEPCSEPPAAILTPLMATLWRELSEQQQLLTEAEPPLLQTASQTTISRDAVMPVISSEMLLPSPGSAALAFREAILPHEIPPSYSMCAHSPPSADTSVMGHSFGNYHSKDELKASICALGGRLYTESIPDRSGDMSALVGNRMIPCSTALMAENPLNGGKGTLPRQTAVSMTPLELPILPKLGGSMCHHDPSQVLSRLWGPAELRLIAASSKLLISMHPSLDPNPGQDPEPGPGQDLGSDPCCQIMYPPLRSNKATAGCETLNACLESDALLVSDLFLLEDVCPMLPQVVLPDHQGNDTMDGGLCSSRFRSVLYSAIGGVGFRGGDREAVTLVQDIQSHYTNPFPSSHLEMYLDWRLISGLVKPAGVLHGSMQERTMPHQANATTIDTFREGENLNFFDLPMICPLHPRPIHSSFGDAALSEAVLTPGLPPNSYKQPHDRSGATTSEWMGRATTPGFASMLCKDLLSCRKAATQTANDTKDRSYVRPTGRCPDPPPDPHSDPLLPDPLDPPSLDCSLPSPRFQMIEVPLNQQEHLQLISGLARSERAVLDRVTALTSSGGHPGLLFEICPEHAKVRSG